MKLRKTLFYYHLIFILPHKSVCHAEDTNHARTVEAPKNDGKLERWSGGELPNRDDEVKAGYMVEHTKVGMKCAPQTHANGTDLEIFLDEYDYEKFGDGFECANASWSTYDLNCVETGEIVKWNKNKRTVQYLNGTTARDNDCGTTIGYMRMYWKDGPDAEALKYDSDGNMNGLVHRRSAR